VAGRGTGARMTPVRRAEVATRHMDVLADVINRQYVEHKAWFQCAARTRVDAGVRSAVAGPTEAAVLRYKGFRYHGQASPPEDFLGLVVLNGHGSFTRARERVHFTRGDALLLPSDQRFDADMDDCVFALVRIPERFVDLLAGEHAGLPATGLRIESMAPVSASACALWSRTATFICRQLLGSAEAGISPILVQEMTRLAAATILESFPNTTMTTAYVPDPGRVPSATVRRATGFILAHAGQPVTIAEIAARAGVTPRALQYAFRRHYDMTITGYLRQIRLERAHRELKAADHTTGETVANIARRWGWANPAGFAAAYRKQYGVPPSNTLRT
jgi:AraC-like DNA-binding protein